MRVQATLSFVPRRASDEARHSTPIEPTPSLSRKRESDSLLVAPSCKKFAVPRRTTGNCSEAPVASDAAPAESTGKAESDPVKFSGSLGSFFQWDTYGPSRQAIDTGRRKVHGKLYAFSAADSGAKPLLEGKSSHSVACESVWRSGVRLLSTFGGPNRTHSAPPVMSINPDGTIALVFQQGCRSMLQMPRENLYDRTAVSNLHYTTCTNQIQDVSWSARSPNKLVVCSSTSSDVELWNVSEGRREAVLNGQTNFTSGVQGFLAVHAFKDSQHMLAAGGYGPSVQLWDARACTQASMSLPLMRDDIVTSLLCSPQTNRIIAGTSSGMLVSWDKRKLAPSSMHVFGSRGPTQAHPSRVDHLPTLAASWPTVLSYNAQLRLCTGILATVGELQSVSRQAVSTARVQEADANAVRSAAGVGRAAATRGLAACRLGLSRSPTLATKSLGSKVNHLVEDPADPHRVAFSLSCGSAGVVQIDNSVVTHVFNPYTYQPRLRPLDMRSARCSPSDIAWSSDGSVLYHTLPVRNLRRHQAPDDVLLPSSAVNVRNANRHMHSGPLLSNQGGVWEDFYGPDDDVPVRRLMCALDTTSQSALRCCDGTSWRPHAAGKAQVPAPFCLEYRMQLPVAEEGMEGSSFMHGEDGSGEASSIQDDSRLSTADAASGRGCHMHARFAVLGVSDSSDGGGNEKEDMGGGLACMPRCLDSGVTFSADGGEEGCTLLHDPFQRSLLMCGPTEIKALAV